ncbi:glycosyltransferase family 2 protein [Texcoconibacillus texcoconensis]|uniref:Cellulose synthase/poly-beta-1,6-N-acetylglucosamine synthase-like glycosyltransferase n=1 Tax=Texcoconibacillus texcoconensis TaxID=1095777 RepID=A0A840QTE6_9BACI|nr:glycosyltransferase family 2 protein [Texcoconibacillus texcoconensis]MBB5174561.1 cellulose synthase/poly-beta-1,6-N-acetylglucosamine synthase-like glycosyltransferase [Texcoconibacillus texcoconensis]
MIIVEIVFWLSLILIFHTMIGYPISLYIIDKFIKKKNVEVDTSMRPKVSIIIPAHNEESVIEKKLQNLINLNYPKDLMEIIISSDNSTDKTNDIVEDFITKNNQNNIRLYKVKKRQGKTNAQNEAVKIANGKILAFSDANSMLEKDAIIHLVSSFVDEKVIYVTGKLTYVNSLDSITSEAENKYWNYDLFMRKVESDVKTITAGNGAIYAIRKSDYVDFDPIRSHDSAMPSHAALIHKKAIFNEKAIAYEKAGETTGDEFKRKVRMSRGGLKALYTDIRKYNPFKYGWYSYFYFGHRACRRALFIFHITLLSTNILLINENILYYFLFLIQISFYLLALMKKMFGLNHKVFYFPYYYVMTLLAQLVGTYNQITGKSKPFWEKAESTR